MIDAVDPVEAKEHELKRTVIELVQIVGIRQPKVQMRVALLAGLQLPGRVVDADVGVTEERQQTDPLPAPTPTSRMRFPLTR